MAGLKDRDNNFGALRLLFAALVVLSHAPEIVDGGRSREILTRIFGTLSFGEAAVDGFFLISGYLVTRSFVDGGSGARYFWKRFLRIVPGFLVCFWICVFAVAPLVGGGGPDWANVKANFFRSLSLSQPVASHGFHGAAPDWLNASMWTISYEVRCYLATACLGLLGFFRPSRRPWFWAGLALLMALNLARGLQWGAFRVPQGGDLTGLFGSVDQNLRFALVFEAGAMFYLLRDETRFTRTRVMAASALLFGLMFSRRLAEPAFTVLGGYLVFWAAFRLPVLGASRFANRMDISYGLYLYAWPAEILVLALGGVSNPWVLCADTLALAALLGALSWVLVEKPALKAARFFPGALSAGAIR